MLGAHKKRTLLIGFAVVLLLLIIFYSLYVGVGDAYVEYLIGNVPVFSRDANNSISIAAVNKGYDCATFYLTLSLTNASFSTLTEQPYVQVSNTSVKFPFILQGRGGLPTSIDKTVFFLINENVTGFSFYLSLEKVNQSPMSSLGIFYSVSYIWNETTRYYQQGQIAGSIP